MSTNIVFIDSRVTDYQTLIDGLTEPTEVFILEGQSDRLAQMASRLQGRSGIDALHIISHGSQGALYSGSTVLDSGNLVAYGSQLTNLGSSLTDKGDILLYGCNVAQGDAGVQFIHQLAELTGADVAASTNVTGSVEMGADWLLELKSDAVEAPIIIASQAQSAYASQPGVLDSNLRFSYVDALTASEMPKAAYERPADINSYLGNRGWDAIHSNGYEVGSAYAFAAERLTGDNRYEFIISYEGSNVNQIADWTATNASEYGWSNYYANLMPLMTEVKQKALSHKALAHDVDLMITGHSLGGAAASVAYADLWLPTGQDFWKEAIAPLKTGQRIYDQFDPSQWGRC